MVTEYEIEPEQHSANQIKYGALVSYASIGFNIISGLIYTPWMIGMIGKEDYGLYVLVFSIIVIFAFNLGLEMIVARFLTHYRTIGEREQEPKFLGAAYKVFFLFTIVLMVILFALYLSLDMLYGNLSTESMEKLKGMYPFVGCYVLVTLLAKPLEAVFITNERFIQLNALLFVEKILIVGLTVLALMMGYGVYALVVVNATVILFITLVKIIYVWRSTDTKVDFSVSNRQMYRDIFSFASWQTLISGTHNFLMHIMPTVLVLFASGVAVAIFSIGMVIEGYVLLIATAINSLFLPKVTRINHSIGAKGVEDLMIRVGRIQLYVIGFITVTFIAIGLEFIQLWVGNDFKESYVVAALLIAMGFITLPQEIANIQLVAKNKIKYRAYGMVISTVIALVLSTILSASLGATGAALSVMIGYLTGNMLFMNIVYVRVLQLDVWRFFKECHLKLAPGLVFTLIVGIVMQSFFPASSLFVFVIKAIVLALIYALFMWVFTIDSFEKGLLQSILPLKRARKGEAS